MYESSEQAWEGHRASGRCIQWAGNDCWKNGREAWEELNMDACPPQQLAHFWGVRFKIGLKAWSNGEVHGLPFNRGGNEVCPEDALMNPSE